MNIHLTKDQADSLHVVIGYAESCSRNGKINSLSSTTLASAREAMHLVCDAERKERVMRLIITGEVV